MNKQEWNPGKLLELSGYFWKTGTLHAGVKLGIFTVIGDKSITADEVAQLLNADKRGITMLLNALTAMNLLDKKDDKYSNNSAGLFLRKDSPQYIGYMIMHHHHLIESWFQLDKGVITGKPVRTRAVFNDDVQRESFLMGMFNNAMGIAPGLAKEIDLSDRRHLLDLGGGPGTYSIHFCMNNPNLKATVYDLPTTRPFAEKTIQRFNMTDQVNFTDGNYIEEDIKGSYDVVWLSHVLHGEGHDDCQKMIHKSVSVLENGGMIMIHEFILNNTMDSPLFPALFSLNMLIGTPHGQAYSEEQIMEMLAKEGIREIKRLSFRGPNESGIIMGIK